jgi:hypothetical protein
MHGESFRMVFEIYSKQVMSSWFWNLEQLQSSYKGIHWQQYTVGAEPLAAELRTRAKLVQ